MTDEKNGSHAGQLQFYNDEATLSRLVAGFLAEGFANGDPAIVVATPEHSAAIEAGLRERSVDVDTLKRLGDCIVLDARETLETFMVDGMPHTETFSHVVGQVLEQVRRGHGDRTIRVYGEAINLLWKDGLFPAAIRLETLWNELATTREFRLLFGYAMGNFYKVVAIDGGAQYRR